jgi:hypothetical protein
MDRVAGLWESQRSREDRSLRTVHLTTLDHILMRKPPASVSDLAARRAPSRARFAWRDSRIDALIDSYVEWREECETVETAYERWTQSERSEHGLAYTAYRAALDREEKAAAIYRVAATRLVDAGRRQRRS